MSFVKKVARKWRIPTFIESQGGDGETRVRGRLDAGALPETVTRTEPAAGKWSIN